MAIPWGPARRSKPTPMPRMRVLRAGASMVSLVMVTGRLSRGSGGDVKMAWACVPMRRARRGADKVDESGRIV